MSAVFPLMVCHGRVGRADPEHDSEYQRRHIIDRTADTAVAHEAVCRELCVTEPRTLAPVRSVAYLIRVT